MYRYRIASTYTTSSDPLDDIVLQLEFLTARDYTIELLKARHGVPIAEAASRWQPIAAHIRLALSYIEQARNGPADVSFLPCYYGILNLVKGVSLA